MNNILIPTDFSDCANAASDCAIEIASLADARLHFVHVQDTAVEWKLISVADQKKYPDTLKAIGHSKSALTKWIRKAESKGVKAERSLIFDAGADELSNHIKKHHYDLVVMGSHGTKGIIGKILGSNTQGVLRSVDTPLLIIKEPVSTPMKKILFVSDFTDLPQASVLPLVHLAQFLKASMELLFVKIPSVIKKEQKIMSDMDAVMAYFPEMTYGKNIVEAGAVQDGVQNSIAESPVDLIAISTHGRGGFQQIFSPSVAEQIMDRSKLPVLTLKL
jgi:nucleotide-binding universal stress UspA family protein